MQGMDENMQGNCKGRVIERTKYLNSFSEIIILQCWQGATDSMCISCQQNPSLFGLGVY